MSKACALVFMGVSGSGKTTLAQAFSNEYGWSFAEADEFHPQANIDKMSQGIALDDDDRWPWLRLIRDWISEQAHQGTNVVLTCSALKRSYRDLLREADAEVRFVLLDASREELTQRMQQREGHYMPASLLDSQLATLERLADDEAGTTLDSTASAAAMLAQSARFVGLEWRD